MIFCLIILICSHLAMPIPLIHPSSIIVKGPCKSGKTVFLRRLLAEKMLSPMSSRIVIVFSEWKPEYNRVEYFNPKTEFIKAPMAPFLEESFSPKDANLLVIDDQMTSETHEKTDKLEKYFIQGSHHRNLSVILILQNLFQK